VQGMQGAMLDLSQIGTSYGRVRCLAPRQIEQMKASLTAHGQLTALVVVKRQERLELIDGFKRRRAAEQMGWTARPIGAHQEFVGLCPLHAESRPSFYVNAAKNIFFCHGCGRGSDLIRFVQLSLNLSLRETLAHLKCIA